MPRVRAIIHKWWNFETVFLSKKALMPHRGHHKWSLGNPWESSEDDQEDHKSSPCLFPRYFWKIFCGLMRQRWNFLESACPVISSVNTALLLKKCLYQLSNNRAVTSAVHWKKIRLWPEVRAQHTSRCLTGSKRSSKGSLSKTTLKSDYDAMAWLWNRLCMPENPPK